MQPRELLATMQAVALSDGHHRKDDDVQLITGTRVVIVSAYHGGERIVVDTVAGKHNPVTGRYLIQMPYERFTALTMQPVTV